MQAELFVIRLSRHSGLAGLAGIPLASDILRCMPELFNGKDVVVRTRLVRPLLHFRKSDLQQVWCFFREISQGKFKVSKRKHGPGLSFLLLKALFCVRMCAQ